MFRRKETIANDTDIVRNTFTGYIREVEEIKSRLEAIAHHSHHHHEHRSFFFSAPHHHTNPHFHEIRKQWETIRDGIGHTFAQFKYRLEIEAKKKEQAKKDKEKLEKEKTEAKEKADAELKKAQEKAKKEKEELEKEKQDAKKKAVEALEEEKAKAKRAADELKKELKEKQQEDDQRLAIKERHEQAKLAHHNEIAEQRDTHVERLVKSKLEEDAIDQMDRFAGVFNKLQHSMGHQEVDPVNQFRRVAETVQDLQHSTSPRNEDNFEQFRRIAGLIKDLMQPAHASEENPIDQARRLAELFNQFQRSSSSSSKAEDPIDQVAKLLKAMKDFQPSSSRSDETIRLNVSTPATTPRPLAFDSRGPPISINNVIESGIPAGDVEEVDINGAHLTAFTGPTDHVHTYQYPSRLPHLKKGTAPRKSNPIPLNINGVDGDFYPRPHG